MASAWPPPDTMAVTPASPDAGAGTGFTTPELVAPTPSWPRLFAPQVHTMPLALSAIFDTSPAAMAVMPAGRPHTWTGVVLQEYSYGQAVATVTPNSPKSLSPQA